MNNKPAQLNAMQRAMGGVKSGANLLGGMAKALGRNFMGNDAYTKQGASRGTNMTWGTAPVKGVGGLSNTGKLGK